jgi:hypothetical protein
MEPKRRSDLALALLIGAILLAGVVWKLVPFGRISPRSTSSTIQTGKTAMTISSPVFDGNPSIPAAYTCDGMDLNPPLSFGDVPTTSVSLALIMHDPDAPSGDWVHWTLWDIPPETQGIAEGRVPSGAIQGVTDFGRSGYGGPCPPDGQHRYIFELVALDAVLGLPSSTKREDLEAAMKGHVIDQAELVGTYKRKP